MLLNLKEFLGQPVNYSRRGFLALPGAIPSDKHQEPQTIDPEVDNHSVFGQPFSRRKLITGALVATATLALKYFPRKNQGTHIIERGSPFKDNFYIRILLENGLNDPSTGNLLYVLNWQTLDAIAHQRMNRTSIPEEQFLFNMDFRIPPGDQLFFAGELGIFNPKTRQLEPAKRLEWNNNITLDRESFAYSHTLNVRWDNWKINKLMWDDRSLLEPRSVDPKNLA